MVLILVLKWVLVQEVFNRQMDRMMKARFYLAMAAAALLMTNCSQDEALNQSQNQGSTNTLTATIEAASRSLVSDGGVFKWAQGDEIAVGNADGSFTKFVSNAEGMFTSSERIVPTGYAIYPYNTVSQSLPQSGLPTITLPSEYSYGSTNAPMLATITGGEANLQFKHLAGLMRFKVKNVPAGATTFTLTADKGITGVFTPTDSEPSISTSEASNTNNKVSITFDASSENRDMDFYIPMPIGTYTSLTVSLSGGTLNNCSLASGTGVTNEITRGKLLLMPTLVYDGTTLKKERDEDSSIVSLEDEDEVELDVNNGDKVVVEMTEDATATLNLTAPNTGSNELTISDGSTDSTASSETSEGTLNVSAENASSLTIDAPTLTVNLTSGNYEKVTAKTAQNTLIIGSGVTIDELIVEGGNVKLEGDLTLEKTLVVSQDMTLDLGGNALTVQNAGGIIVKNGTFTIKNGKLLAETTGYDAISIQGEDGSSITVNVESNATLKGGDCCIVVPVSNASTDITINTSGTLKTESTGYAAISANGNSEGVKLNVSGGSITASMAGIYFPCETYLNITGGEITGATAVYQKSGTLTISGGTLTGNGEAVNYTYNGNGCNETGDALVIESCNYPKGTPSVNITGGTFISENAKAIGSYVGNGVDVAGKITGFVYGGLFSDASAFEHLGNGADVTLTQAVTITESIVIKNGIEATINLKGSVTANGCDAFKVEGTLTIDSGDTNEVTASGDNVCAVWACGGTVTINGGHYKVGADSEGKRNDCIYAGYNADGAETLGTITIKSGTFEYTAPRSDENVKDGDLFLLNCADSDEDAHIIVEGGTFKNHVPGLEPVGDNEVALGEGKKVYNGEAEATSAHTGTTDIWYTVK